jgi:hypothetical protein
MIAIALPILPGRRARVGHARRRFEAIGVLGRSRGTPPTYRSPQNAVE